MSKDEMKQRMEKLKEQRDILVKKKAKDLQKEWDNFDEKDDTPDSRKGMISKGLAALNIKEGAVKYTTEEQKETAKQKKISEKKKKKEEEESKKADESSGPPKASKPEPAHLGADVMEKRRLIFSKIKELNMQEGNEF
mmetsp:Transcript_16365/g.18199  ORF Transcript_16365/g.18199 Transcript_16365/m.18199 type:complete len:138 (-) Transcript_16365:13-426(-)